MPSIIELPFLAPIPRGHDVVVVTFTLDDRSPTLVVDRTAGTVYCPDALAGALQQDPLHAVADPISTLTRWSWTVKSTMSGVCAGALVSTRVSGNNRYELKTHLLMEPAATTGH